MTTLTENLPTVNYAVSGDTILFSGGGNDLIMSFCSDASVVMTGFNEVIGIENTGADVNIYDLGKQNSISFFGTATVPFETAMPWGDLTIRAFQLDPTGSVILEAGQTAAVTSDGYGGSWLAISGPGAALAHFIGDPAANLSAHILIAT